MSSAKGLPIIEWNSQLLILIFSSTSLHYAKIVRVLVQGLQKGSYTFAFKWLIKLHLILLSSSPSIILLIALSAILYIHSLKSLQKRLTSMIYSPSLFFLVGISVQLIGVSGNLKYLNDLQGFEQRYLGPFLVVMQGTTDMFLRMWESWSFFFISISMKSEFSFPSRYLTSQKRFLSLSRGQFRYSSATDSKITAYSFT